MKNFMCGYNTTKDQLQILQSQKLNDLEHAIVTLVSDTKQMHEKQLFVFQNKQLTALHFVGKDSETKFFTALVGMPKRISTLNCFGIDKYTITSEVAIDIANILSHNKGLEQLYFSSKLRMTDLLKIVQVLAKFMYLKVLEIGNITDQITEYLTLIISDNARLQYFSINGDLCTTNVVKISKAVQNTSNLQELTITGNNTSTTNVIAANNSKTQKLNDLEDNMQTMCIKIAAKRLQNIPTLANLHTSINSNIKEDIAGAFSCNTHPQGFVANFRTKDAIAIIKTLQTSFILEKLCISNKISVSEVGGDIAAVIYNNSLLQDFDVSKSNLQSTAGIKIVKALQTICTLTKLYISNNTITEETADDIAAVICNNIQLQEFGVGKNNLQSTGAIKIAKALQNISTLTKLYINNNHITDLAADDIAAVLSRNTKLQELDISENSFQTTGAKTITKALQSGWKLYISNNDITAEAADDIAAVIYRSTQLQEVDVSRNSFQSTGAIKIAKALQNISTLTKLYLNNNHITYLAADDIATVLSCNTQLQELDISENNFQTTGAKTITKALRSGYILRKLYISNNNITAEAADDIAAVICCNTQLQEFNISNNKLQATGVIIIAKALRSITTLKKLCISNNIYFGKNSCIKHIQNTTEEAAYSFAEAVSCNIKLQEIDFSKNYFPTIGIVKIMQVLQNIVTIKKLYVININITEEAADDFAAALAFNTQLQELDISKNNLQTQGTIKIAKALQGIFTLKILRISNNNIADDAADDIAAAVSHSYQLKVFSISRNCVGAPGMIKIARALQQISTLQSLYINNNRITDEASDDIVAVCSHNTQLRQLFINSNLFTDTKIVELKDHCHELNSEIYIRCANQYNSKHFYKPYAYNL